MCGCWQGKQPSIRALHLVRGEAEATHEIVLLAGVHDAELPARGQEKRGESRMTDDRDICDLLEDHRIDGAIYLRFNAAKEIRYLRFYVARLEGDLAKEEFEHAKTKIALRKAREHISDQAIDIVTLGQEVGRLREAMEEYVNTVVEMEGITFVDQMENAELRAVVKSVLAEQGEKP